ncbi:hypothetical protein QUC31_000514 [Theobroma cacao]
MSYCIFSFCSRSALRFPRNHLVSTDNSAPILLNDPLKIFSLSFLGFKTGFHRRLMEVLKQKQEDWHVCIISLGEGLIRISRLHWLRDLDTDC